MSDDNTNDKTRYYDLERPPLEKVRSDDFDDENVDQTIEKTKSGVTVTVKSKRGTDPRDQDEVTVKAHHADLEEAYDSTVKTNETMHKQMEFARRNDPNDDREEQ